MQLMQFVGLYTLNELGEAYIGYLPNDSVPYRDAGLNRDRRFVLLNLAPALLDSSNTVKKKQRPKGHITHPPEKLFQLTVSQS